MSIDRLVALGARDDWLAIVAKWPALRNALRPGGGNALSGMPPGGGNSAVPIDLHVSDLMHEITESARFYGRILHDEAPPMHGCSDACYQESPPIPVEECPDRQDAITTSFMPGLLVDVAARYGHFTEAEDEMVAIAFCDDASDYRDRVRKTLERPAAPTYVGPCQADNCAGELKVREGRDAGTCPECGAPFTLAEQREWLTGELENRLMTMSEIVSALVVLGVETPVGTVKSWISRGNLGPAIEGERLYRLADAKVLAEARGKVGA